MPPRPTNIRINIPSPENVLLPRSQSPRHTSPTTLQYPSVTQAFSPPLSLNHVHLTKSKNTPKRHAMQCSSEPKPNRTKAKPNQTKPASMSLPPKRHLNNQTKSKNLVVSHTLPVPFPFRTIVLSNMSLPSPHPASSWKKNERHTPLFVPDQPHVVICSRPKNPTPPPQSKYQRAALHYITIIAFPRTRHPKSPASVRVGREKGKRRCEERKEGREREEGISKTKNKKNEGKKRRRTRSTKELRLPTVHHIQASHRPSLT